MKTIQIAKALILDSSGNMLLLRRSNTHPTLALRPDLPGGQIDDGEEPGDALVREVVEETGLQVLKSQLNLVYSGAEVHDKENRVRMLYVIKLHEKEPKVVISWEHDSAEWVPVSKLAEIETEFHSFYHDALGYVRKHDLL